MIRPYPYVPINQPWTPYGKTAQEIRDAPEAMRNWEEQEREKDRLLDEEIRLGNEAQAKFDRKMKLVSSIIAFVVFGYVFHQLVERYDEFRAIIICTCGVVVVTCGVLLNRSRKA